MSPGEGDIVLDFSESITVRNIFSKLGALQCLYTVQIIPRTDQDSVEVFTLILFSTSSSWSCSPKNVQCCHRQLTIKWNFRCLFSSQKSTSSWAVSASSEKGWQKIFVLVTRMILILILCIYIDILNNISIALKIRKHLYCVDIDWYRLTLQWKNEKEKN